MFNSRTDRLRSLLEKTHLLLQRSQGSRKFVFPPFPLRLSTLPPQSLQIFIQPWWEARFQPFSSDWCNGVQDDCAWVAKDVDKVFNIRQFFPRGRHLAEHISEKTGGHGVNSGAGIESGQWAMGQGKREEPQITQPCDQREQNQPCLHFPHRGQKLAPDLVYAPCRGWAFLHVGLGWNNLKDL